MSRNLILCISDIHLGIDDRYGQINKNRTSLIHFLKSIRHSPKVKELIFNGDLFDQWFVPGNIDTLNDKSQLGYLKSIADNNTDVIKVIRDIINDNKIKVIYIPGNHDMLFSKLEIDFIFPGILQFRDANGLGRYTPSYLPELLIEHGHRYDFYCAPDALSNLNIVKDSILPVGYFYCRLTATSFIDDSKTYTNYITNVKIENNSSKEKLAYLYWLVWKNSLLNFPIKYNKEDKFIITNINSFKENYSLADLIPYNSKKTGNIIFNLFPEILNTWQNRQKLNNVSINIPIEEAITHSPSSNYIDDMSKLQYFNNSKSRFKIIVFGHTHSPSLFSYTNNNYAKCIYANCGSWVDKAKASNRNTFICISIPEYNCNTKVKVDLYSYSSTNNIKLLNSEIIY